MRKTAFIAALVCSVSAGAAFAQPGDLSAYGGLYPHDEVDGVMFIEHPLVVEAVRSVVPFEELQDRILKETFDTATVVPLRDVDGKLLMWAFDPPTAGDANWGLIIAPDGSAISVCSGSYENDEHGTDWYTAEGHQYIGDSRCPSEAGDIAAFEAVIAN